MLSVQAGGSLHHVPPHFEGDAGVSFYFFLLPPQMFFFWQSALTSLFPSYALFPVVLFVKILLVFL
jgi:hypothetical protein